MYSELSNGRSLLLDGLNDASDLEAARGVESLQAALRETFNVHEVSDSLDLPRIVRSFQEDHAANARQAITDALAGNGVGFIEDTLSLLILCQIVKAFDAYAPVESEQLATCLSIAFSLYALKVFVSYHLINIGHMRQHFNSNQSSSTGLDLDGSRRANFAAPVLMLLGAADQCALDGATLLAGLLSRYSSPQQARKTPSFYVFLLVIALASLSHAVLVGFGVYAQSLRKAGLLSKPQAAYSLAQSPRFQSFLRLWSALVPALMTSAYFAGILISTFNLLEFFSLNPSENNAARWLGSVLTFLQAPFLYADYLCVMSKVEFLHWTLGLSFNAEVEPQFLKAPFAFVLERLHAVYHQMFFARCLSGNAFDRYDNSLYAGKLITRMSMLMGVFYSVGRVYQADPEPMRFEESWIWGVAPFISLVFAYFSAKLEYQSFGSVPAKSALAYKASLFVVPRGEPIRSHTVTAHETRRTFQTVSDQLQAPSEDVEPVFTALNSLLYGSSNSL